MGFEIIFHSTVLFVDDFHKCSGFVHLLVDIVQQMGQSIFGSSFISSIDHFKEDLLKIFVLYDTVLNEEATGWNVEIREFDGGGHARSQGFLVESCEGEYKESKEKDETDPNRSFFLKEIH